MGKNSWKQTKSETCPICSKEYKFLARHIELKHEREDAVAKEDEGKDKEGDQEQTDIAGALKGIGEKLERIDTDVCSKFPELCAKVDRLEKAIPDTVEPGSERWITTRSADLEHALFEDCPECNTIRDALLKAKGKRLADVEVEEEAKVEEVAAKVEVEEKTKVDEEQDTLDEPEEKRRSGGYFYGSRWDDDEGCYIEQ